ncbi:MAG: hypothetical protein HKL80_08065 [Acidimicrobiales bacterium]|nr:hypothetical protein [Acidimicrobiales bacterium]
MDQHTQSDQHNNDLISSILRPFSQENVTELPMEKLKSESGLSGIDFLAGLRDASDEKFITTEEDGAGSVVKLQVPLSAVKTAL